MLEDKLIRCAMGPCAVSVAALMAWTPAHADTAATPQLAAQSNALGEVVVTARRRDERLQDVPVVVTVMNKEALRNAQVTTARQLIQFVPSLNVGTGNSRDYQRFTLRGQGVTLGAGEGVTAYVNEAPLPQFAAGGPGLYFDLDNLQVLNGPQGTLFGRNTTGGAMLFTPARPVDRNEGSIQAGYGNYNNREITGVANWAAIPGVLDIRFAGEFRQRDGFTTDYWDGSKYDDINYQAYRLGVLFKPTSHIQNYLVLSYNRSNTDGTGFILTDVNPAGSSGGVFGLNSPTATATAFGATQGLNGYLAQQQQLGIRTSLGTAPHFWFEENTRAVNTTTIDLPYNLTLKNIASFDRERVYGGFDIDGTPDPIVEWKTGPYLGNPSGFGLSKNEYLTEELQLQGKSFGGKFNWVIGGFYQHYYPYGGAQGVDGIQFGALQQTLTGEAETSKAVFGQGTLDLGEFTPVLDRLKLTVGYRYTWDDKSYVSDVAKLPSGVCVGTVAPAVLPNCAIHYAAGWNAPTYTIGLDYKVLSNLLVYVKTSKGYKSGGFNGGGTNPLSPTATFGPEYVTDYEGGIKADLHLMDVPVRVDLAVFHDDYKDMQRNNTTLIDPAGCLVNPANCGQVNVVTNAGAAAIDGAEFQLEAKFHAVDINFNYSYLDARYTNYQYKASAAATPLSLNGLQLPYAPTHKIGVSVTYHLPIDPALGELSVNAAANYQSSYRWGDVDSGHINSPEITLGNYALVNFGANWDHVAGRPVHLEVFVTNALDGKYRAGSLAYYYSVGQAAVSYIEPRMFGFRVRYDFGSN
jgi:iron complex outermembrane receptor protein